MKNAFPYAFTILFVLFMLAGCANAVSTPTSLPATAVSTLTSVPATPTSKPLSGPYLGQTPPGMTPEIFAPGIVSDPDFTEFSGTFSPDGSEYYFYRFSASSEDKIYFSKVVDGKWTAPEQLAVTAGYIARQPYVTFDNQKLYFYWNRPVAEGQPGYPAKDGYYVSTRTANGWSEPSYAGLGMLISSSRDGQLYTTDISKMRTRRTYLAKITVTDGLFTNYETLTVQPGMGNQAHPCIALDGSYLLFDVDGGSHLFISFKKADGSWGEAIDLTEHGFDPLAGGATISPDGKYLFFSLHDDIWWVDIKTVESLRPQE